MMMERIYLDHNATTTMLPTACDAFYNACHLLGNPSSIHFEGRKVKSLVEKTRHQLADYLHITRDMVFFTANASEANNLLLHQFSADTIISGCDGHESLLAVAHHHHHHILPITSDGFYDLTILENIIQHHDITLLAITIAHNETGVIQPITHIYDIAKKYNIWLHIDAVQAFGKIATADYFPYCDSMTISAHKCGGAKGVGALILRQKKTLKPLILGGGQESGARAGTENIAAIHAFLPVINMLDMMIENYASHKEWHDMLRQHYQHDDSIQFAINHDRHLPNTTLLMMPPCKSVNVIMALDIVGFAVSAGSACSSGKHQQSQILNLMGYHDEIAQSSLRISTGINNTQHDIEKLIHTLPNIIKQQQLL